MLKALQRERDAAIAQSRALEREREATLAATKVRELTNAAELGAVKAREREKAAMLAEIKAQERARAVEREGMVVTHEPEHAAAPQVKPSVIVPAAKAVETAVRIEPKPTDKFVAAETPTKFSADPCKGPSAKFLSTCNE
jgi:hypothetical protein